MVIQTFLDRCDAYAERRGISRARLSTLLFNDGKKLDALAGGRDVGVLTLERVTRVLAQMERDQHEGAAA
jgi:hypothetical protein